MSLNVNCPCGSGKKFAECHGGNTPQQILAADATAPTHDVHHHYGTNLPQLAKPLVTRKLDLACGQTPLDGFEGVDIFTGAKHVVDLMKYPWPFEDSSVAELHCSHFIEHIPAIHVNDDGSPAHGTTGRDALFRFFDECYRILVPGGKMRVQWPALRSNRAFQDPTHRRFIPEETIALYLNADWRKLNHLDHYNVICHFAGNVGHTYDSNLNKRDPQVVREYLIHRWNHAVDFVGDLVSQKPA